MRHLPEIYFPLEIDPFMQPRGAPSTFAGGGGGLKEEPLRTSWPAMLVDPSWYVNFSVFF
jgi:hypothetical protein